MLKKGRKSQNISTHSNKPIHKDIYGCEHHWVIRDDVTLGLSASLFTFGSFVYFGGYLILFPQIRQTVTECCNGSGA